MTGARATRPAAVALQRRRILRWVAAVGLLASAEEQSGIDVPETNAIGLLVAHAACEAMLGLLVGPLPYEKGHPPDNRYFPSLLRFAASKANPPLAIELLDDLTTMHGVRNGFVHHGQTVDAFEVDRAIEAGHALAENVPLPGNRGLVGVATVIADVIQMDAIGMWLRHADEMRHQGRLRLSADGVARALDSALDRTDPRVRRRTGRTGMQIARDLGDYSARGTLDRNLAETRSAIDALTRWVYPMALGTAPATIDYIRSVVGSEQPVDIGGHPRPVQRPSPDEPPERELRRAMSLVSRLILRLWAMGSLSPGRQDDLLVELAQEFLSAPGGIAAGLGNGELA